MFYPIPNACYIDFEFNQVVEKDLNLVCASVLSEKDGLKEFWLHKDPAAYEKLKNYLRNFPKVISYSAVAEARSYFSLGINALDYHWIDLFLEYRCLTNHNNNLCYGKQLQDGKIINTFKPRPKWERSEEDGKGFKPTHSLAEATFKLLGIVIDTEEKTRVRDLIISSPEDFTAKEKKEIQKYCSSDVQHLPALFIKVIEQYRQLLSDPKYPSQIEYDEQELLDEMFLRGSYSAHTAKMERDGYPIDYEKTKNFSASVDHILTVLQKEINELFPEIKPFRWNPKELRYSWNQLATREWIRETHPELTERWMKTDGGKKNNPDLSLSLEAWTQFFDFKHTYPKDNFGAQVVRFLKMKQTIYGFTSSPNSSRKNFWDSVGSDKMVRPYMNPYGAQSSRSQPASSGFMFLKPAWMRALVVPPSGEFLAGIDYASEEFFLQALAANDQNMIQAYLSGDVYLAFGKLCGMIPENGTKATHGFERDACKATVLGISYLMSKYGLAIKLTNDTGRVWTEDEAQEMIDLFYDTFRELQRYQDDIVENYKDFGHIKLPCGWYMWGDNENHRSVTNVPTQGAGASIMRRAVDLAYKKKVDTVFTLHDAIYIRGKVGEEYKVAVLRDCMREAFVKNFKDPKIQEFAKNIRLDPFLWGPDYKDGTMVVGDDWYEIPTAPLYLDDRSMEDYNSFSKFFQPSSSELL